MKLVIATVGALLFFCGICVILFGSLWKLLTAGVFIYELAISAGLAAALVAAFWVMVGSIGLIIAGLFGVFVGAILMAIASELK